MDKNLSAGKPRMSVVITVGFMIFATFFGAGNLIFPSYLGFVGGSSGWLGGFIAFVIADAVLGILGLVASARYPQTEIGTYYRVGEKFMVIFGVINLFFAGNIIVNPRTAATAFEVAIRPLAPDFPVVIFLLLYFGLVTLCALRPSKVVDIIGKYLTPALLVLLAALFVVGFINGGSGARYEPLDTGYDSTFAFGLVEGYQTFDLNTGTAIALIITTSFAAKGITNSKEQSKTLAWSGIIGAICCALVYLGLTLMGVLMSNDTALLEMFESTGLDRTYLLNYVIHAYLGDLGTWLMALIVLLATFTSCLGCVGLCNQLYMRATKGKLNYKLSVIITMIMAFVIAALGYTAAESGVEFILSLALPFICAALPVTVALTILTLFTNQIKNDNVYRAAAVMAFICGVVSYFKIPGLYDVLSGSWNVLAPYGFDWVFPTIVAAIIGNFIKYKGFESRPYLRENAGKDQ